MVKELEFHPIANIFPLMQGKAFEELCEDLKANGLLEPIWLYEGQILDGRNRYRGCDEIGYELKETDFRAYEGDDPYSFAGSLNIHRRHLTSSQRAMIVSDLVTAKFGRRPEPGDITCKQAAAVLGTTADAVTQARTVKRRGIPELIATAAAGEIDVAHGAMISGLSPEKQKLIIDRVRQIRQTGEAKSGNTIEKAIQEVNPGFRRVSAVQFISDLDEMAVRILDYFTAPQIDLLWDTIAKKQAELIKARREKQ